MTTINKYFIGGELEALILGSRAGTTWTTTAGTYDANFSRGAVFLPGGGSTTDYINMPLTTPQLDCWVSFQSWRQLDAGGSQSQTWFEFVNANLTPIYRIQGVGGTGAQPVVQFQYFDGAAWHAIGIALVVPTGNLNKWDFHLKSDASTGVLAAYIDGQPFGSVTGNTIFTSPTALAGVHHYPTGPGPVNALAVSEGMIFDISTLGRRLYTLGETANGSNSQWTGSYTDINEVGTYNDSNFIQTGTVNQTSTFVTSTISSTPSQQYLVSGLVVAGRILIGAVGPQNLKGAVVVGGTTYDSTNNVGNLLTSFGYTWSDFDENPNTGVDWTIGIINGGIETGWKSLT